MRGGLGRLVTSQYVNITNEGLISADVSGETIEIVTPRFSNLGTIQAINGGQIVYLAASPLLDSGDFGFYNDGQLLAMSGQLGSGFRFDCPVNLMASSLLRVELDAGSWTDGAALEALSLELGGTLDVTLAGIFTPLLGSTFHLLSSSDTSGTFARVNLPDLPTGQSWDLSRLSGYGTIQVIPAPGVLSAGLFGAVLLAARRKRA